ncbi:MAG: hypothetical protein VX252_04650 [Myxococcota bacterium]|nr:hypothetical protein [Myxococcota bacterium]
MGHEQQTSYSFPDHPETWERKGIRSLGRFITELELIDETGQHIRWNARRHRKGLGPLTNETVAEVETLTQRLNRPIAVRFIIGASLFFIAAVLGLLNIGSAFLQNTIYFTGSIFFTLAGYLQYVQSINNSEDIHLRSELRRWRWLAWQPGRMDFWVVSSQLVGTVAFNFNTFDAFLSQTPSGELLGVGIPDVFGSILFMVSGTLGVIEFNHRLILWPSRSLQSWITMINFWGCVLFMISAVITPVTFLDPSDWSEASSVGTTAAGALAFLTSSVMMLYEK